MGRYQEGLGQVTYGKEDFQRKMDEMGLRQKDTGEITSDAKEEIKKFRRRERRRTLEKNLRKWTPPQ